MKKVISFLRYHALHVFTLECGHIVYMKRRRPVRKEIRCEHCERP